MFRYRLDISDRIAKNCLKSCTYSIAPSFPKLLACYNFSLIRINLRDAIDIQIRLSIPVKLFRVIYFLSLRCEKIK